MNKVSKTQIEELQRLATKRDSDIDTSDILEIADWSNAQRGCFYRPIKQQVTLRLDADILAWFKSDGGKYQTRINAALREYIQQHHSSGG